jgi:tRNA1(Val) A37 N6-methylase TrmN6
VTARPADAPETFLAGRVIARQPEKGYRAAADTVLLGAAVAVGAGERAVELGCGSGAALLVAAWRNPGANFVGIERDADLVALARENALANPSAPRVEILAGDALATPPEEREQFDHAFFNPPYHDDARAVRPPRDAARRDAFLTEEGGVAAWIGAALKRVRSRGRVTLIHRADRLADVLAVLSPATGEIRVRPIQPKAQASAHRIIVWARKGARSPLALLPPLVLHNDDGTFTNEAAAIFDGVSPLALSA